MAKIVVEVADVIASQQRHVEQQQQYLGWRVGVAGPYDDEGASPPRLFKLQGVYRQRQARETNQGHHGLVVLLLGPVLGVVCECGWWCVSNHRHVRKQAMEKQKA